MQILKKLTEARELARKEHSEADQKKLGTLRVGNSGIMSSDGSVAGSCVRKAHLRQLGVEIEEPSEDKLIMFELGIANEDVTAKLLSEVLEPGQILLREEEIPVSWTTESGVPVSGRPDLVVCSAEDKKPELGIELKSVHSMWTARTVLFEGQPKLPHLIQAAHYMWKLDVPYKLVYKAYSQLGQSMSDWAKKFFPKQGEKFSEYVDYNPKGDIKGLKQFEVAYDLRFNPRGQVEYKREEDDRWITTIIQRDDIVRFYETAATLATASDLGPRPTTVDAHGDKLNYKDCNYCSLSTTCDAFEKRGYAEWLAEVKQVTKKK